MTTIAGLRAKITEEDTNKSMAMTFEDSDNDRPNGHTKMVSMEML